MMRYKLRSPLSATSVLLPVAMVALAFTILVADLRTTPNLAFSTLYSIIVLLAVHCWRVRGILLVAAGCIGLVFLSYALRTETLGNALIGVTAIALTTVLTVQIGAARAALDEQVSLLEMVHDAIISRSMADVITYWNRAAEELYGWKSTEAMGKTPQALLQTIFPVPLEQIKATLLREGRWEGKLVNQARDGRRVVVISRWSLHRDKRGRPAMILQSSSDITERERGEEALRESEARFRHLADTAPVLIWTSGLDKLCTYFNQRWLDFTGRTLVQELGNGWAEGVHPDDFARCLHTYQSAFNRREPFRMEYRLRRSDGQFRWLDDTGVPNFSAGGEFLGYIGSCIDITERARTQEALVQAQADLARANRAMLLGEMTASIAHEVKQPILAVITGANAGLRWLNAPEPNLDEARQAFELVVKGGNRASEIVERVRALVKKVPPRRDRANINEVVRDVIALTQAELRRNGVTVQTRLSDALHPVSVDRVQMQQVLMNLIVNAVEAMSGVSNGSRELTIVTDEADSDNVLIEVRDTGLGLNSDNLDRLFDSFYTTKPDGIGMGLAISRSIVEAHGGRLWAASNKPHGAAFCFTLPAEEKSSACAEPPHTSPA